MGLETVITDAEKMFAFQAAMLEELGNIRRAVDETEFNIDMYGDDPGGTFGIIQGPQKSTTAAPIFVNFNGPYLITSLLATWVTTSVTAVTLQLKDRTLQLVPASGIFNPQGMMVQMDRDDQIILTVAPKQPCHLEIFGQPDERVRNYVRA